ncbi:helix-turn-helix domain-containing protein [Acidimicrobiia bacterium EGI L10123]|nr:helix-turn-helix domain-containing protein [Acidimicrobiia bacterium EGI L10123]
MTLTEASERTGIPVPTALRLMRTLEADAFAVRLADGRYVLGPAALRIAYEADPDGPLRWMVRSAVLRLRDRTNETVSFFVRRDGELLCLETAESRAPVRWVCPRGSRSPLHLTAAGKTLLAHGPTRELLDRLAVDNGTFECAGGRVRTLADLESELMEIRSGAPAVSDQESSPDAWDFALPLMVKGVCLGAFAVGYPRSRAPRTEGDLRQLIDVCAEIVTDSLDEALLTYGI